MSGTVYYKGTLKEIIIPESESIESFICNSILSESDRDSLHIYYDGDVLEYLFDTQPNSYFYHNKTLYAVDISTSEQDSTDTFMAHKTDNGDIAFEVQYHNGGCSFNEALEEAIRKNILCNKDKVLFRLKFDTGSCYDIYLDELTFNKKKNTVTFIKDKVKTTIHGVWTVLYNTGSEWKVFDN
jgi:hypothetical protein